MDVEFTEKLIQEVKNRPILYLQNHPDCKNNIKKLQAWKQIQRELNGEVETLKAKWKNLKDTYKKYKQSKQSTSGPAKKLQNWVWADHMSFIEPSVYLNETQIGIKSPNAESDDNSLNSTSYKKETIQDINYAQECSPRETEIAQQTYRRRRNNAHPTNRRIYYPQNRKRGRDIDDSKVNVKCEGEDLLFLGYANTFKKLSKRKQVKVKFDIARIFMEAELSDLDTETDTSRQAPTTSRNYSMISEGTVTEANEFYFLPHDSKTDIVTDSNSTDLNLES